MPYPLSPFGCDFDAKILFKLGDDDDYTTVTAIQIEELLKWLCSTPEITSYRVNTLKTNIEMVQTSIKQHIQKTCVNTCIKVYKHPVVQDVVIVEHPRPMFSHGDLNPQLKLHDKEVIVDVICGAAILRGAHIYAPGVIAMLSETRKGDFVSIYADLAHKCKKGFQKKYVMERTFLGNGIVKLDRSDLFCEFPSTKGVAIQVIETISHCPSLGNDFLSDGDALLQNLPSIICVQVLNPKPWETILDMCASPGNKTTHIAALMQNQGKLIAIDKTPQKILQLKENCKLFDANVVEVLQYDSTKLVSESENMFDLESFDKILLDAPCSALGKRPQLLNTTSYKVLRSYVPLQRKLFKNAVPLLKTGGTLLYSTCTITIAENEGIVAWALKNFPCLRLVECDPHLGGPGFEVYGLNQNDTTKMQRFGPDQQIDSVGFFLAKFTKCS